MGFLRRPSNRELAPGGRRDWANGEPPEDRRTERSYISSASPSPRDVTDPELSYLRSVWSHTTVHLLHRPTSAAHVGTGPRAHQEQRVRFLGTDMATARPISQTQRRLTGDLIKKQDCLLLNLKNKYKRNLKTNSTITTPLLDCGSGKISIKKLNTTVKISER